MKSPKIKPMTPGVSSAARVRAYLAGAVVTVGLVGVAMKAWALQVDDGDKYRQLAERQHALRLDIPAPRGEVLDRLGRPLAISADADSVWANPREVRDVTGTAEKLAQILGEDAGVLEAKLAGDRRFVWLDRHIAPEVAKAVRDAKLPGIEVAREPRRWYPAKTVAGPVIGRADIDSNGLDGIELSMNDLLKGKRGVIQAIRDARGRRMLANGIDQAEGVPGATVKLSLDQSIQAISEAALADAVTTNKAKSGVAVVLDVETGRVLALASYPTYDPNSGHMPHGARNKPVTDSFEAGSVMKVFSVAAALEAGVVTPQSGFSIGSAFKVGPKSITDVHSFPYLTVSEIIKHSSNIGAAKVSLRLGAQKLYEGYKRFGFGARTGIELPGEQVGMLRKGDTWREVELATMSYGYGLTVTPLQIAAALAAIGNHGVYHAPRIVDYVVDGDGTIIYRGVGEEHRALSQKVADEMLPILASVFDKGPDGGTAKGIDVPGFECGGKTGTAYKYDPATHHYATDRYLASFAGLAPIDHPRLAIVVQVDEPSAGNHYGGTVSAPAFATIASESLRYLGVPGAPLIPTDKEGRPLVMLDPTGRPLRGPQGNYIPVPQANKPKPAPKPTPTPVVVTAPQDVDPAPAVSEIPDFTGMGVSRALDEARKHHLEVEMTGTGQVVEQELVASGKIKLHFSDDTRRISAP
ncbi:MAG TPA: penicillin-binding transpeptidase domain-containing protein [Kofleriaceae bacterium]|nr:penicillin-binding transpeptidase domain-containing protein [Kofleriaceae bacterium]